MNSLLNPAGYVTRLAIRLEYILYLLGLDPTVAIEGFRHNRGNFKERDFFIQKCFDRHFIGSVQYGRACPRSEEHTSELQSLMRISYAVFCLKKKNKQI